MALIAALAMIAVSCGGSSTSVETSVSSDAESGSAEAAAPAESAPEAEASLVAATVSGGQIDIGALEGQDVVFWFWAPW